MVTILNQQTTNRTNIKQTTAEMQKNCNFIAKQSILLNKILIFLSDPGPIIVYPCQSLTNWLTTLLKIDWIDLNMQTMQTMQTM